LFGLLEVVDGFADLAPHGVGCGQVDEVAGLPLGGQAAGVDGLGQVEGLPGIAQDDGDGDGVDSDVGWPELGAVVVAVLADALGQLAGLVQMLVRHAPVVVLGRSDGQDKVAGSVE